MPLALIFLANCCASVAVTVAPVSLVRGENRKLEEVTDIAGVILGAVPAYIFAAALVKTYRADAVNRCCVAPRHREDVGAIGDFRGARL
jgi:hypothetical protein